MFLSAAGFSIFGMMRGRCSWGDMGRYGGDMGEIWDDEGALLLGRYGDMGRDGGDLG